MKLRIAIVVAAFAGVLVVPSGAVGAALPPQLVAKLEADRREANAVLAAARKRLGTAASAQREAAATAGRIEARAVLFESALALVDAEVPDALVAEPRSTTAEAVERADAALDAATEATSSAQAVALDSDRRLRALQRASATEDDRDTTLGSWRFGSGGPSVSADSIDAYLLEKGSPMSGQGAAFLEAGVEHEIDPRLVVAIAGAESYFGIQTCAPLNAWGWGCPNSPFSFRDWAHAIDTITLGIREGYVDDGLTTVGEIHLRYAPPNAENDPTDLNYAWPDNVARFLVEQGGDPEDIEGVLGPSR